METQILKLDAPFDYIYCNGSIGQHIATMIVYETKTNEDGDYELVTHSHPVVKYRNRPGGTVWNRAELTDCTVLCREDNKRITMEQFYNFVREIGTMRLAERSDDDESALSVDGGMWKSVIDMNNIDIEWPMLRKNDGSQTPQVLFEVGLDIRRTPDGSKNKYVLHDMGATDEASYRGGAGLYFFFEFNTEDELKLLLMSFVQSYYRAFSNHQFNIEFLWEEGSEFADVVNEVNRLEPKIRENCNDIDV